MDQKAKLAAAAAVVFSVSACGALDFGEVEGVERTKITEPETDNNNLGTAGNGRLFGDSFSLGSLSDEAAGAQLPVNKHIWRSTLETLSFLPLSSTDPYGGVIVTDWAPAPANPDERIKVTAFISSAEFKPQALKVVVNRQQKDERGSWVAAPVANDTGRKLEDAILTRARQIRIAEGDGS